ncbi:uncharacterized protein MONOS_14353 [Monocercomonoides exilis]|uniref:uncharacterized protein n=1 Tax=Monocercomonoides exilis TaxID=2049356 RepID=UPI00355941A7|nr:hypothetical protein MONOS_14353 [Monocercomonoides exilis]|eukprot:MONOS_14353.1-p1 / transcript=MONOS_14353.1 / gene=MONOS_14353 / organism=Monocercomonoides_exilis_PA203 / gene_product=unspecified product / transcript_product=unspecified product / location=Mono_scaffold00986:16963-17586(+) / protein_length=208 / sequence_SO=supercontig / SO=protein_coding / is_pseudo=false
MFLSAPSAVPVKAVHGRTKSDVINSRPSVFSSFASASSSQSSHPSQHPQTQQSTYQPSSLKSSLRFDELQSHSTSTFLRSINKDSSSSSFSSSSSSSSSSSKRRSILYEKPLVLQSSRAPAASLYLRLPSDEVEVLKGVTSLLRLMKAALFSHSMLGEDNISNRNCNRRSRNDGSYRSDEITDNFLFADEDGNPARLDCLLPSSASS